MSDADSTPMFRVCNRCDKEQPISEFHKNKKGRGGHVAFCKSCKRIEMREYYVSNSDAIKLRAKLWEQNNAERSKETAKLWVTKNLEKSRSIKAAWRERNRETENVRAAERRMANPAARRASSIKYYQANRERYRTYLRNRRAAMRVAGGKHTHDDVSRLHSLQRGRCAHCGKSLKDGYHVDHIEPIARGGSNAPENLQLLCPTCNKRKGAKDPIRFAQENGRLL